MDASPGGSTLGRGAGHVMLLLGMTAPSNPCRFLLLLNQCDGVYI